MEGMYYRHVDECVITQWNYLEDAIMLVGNSPRIPDWDPDPTHYCLAEVPP